MDEMLAQDEDRSETYLDRTLSEDRRPKPADRHLMKPKANMTKGGSIILRIYFALVSFVTLMMLIFSVSDLINVTLKTFVFPGADAPEYPTYCDKQYQTQEQCDQQKENEGHAAMVRKQQNVVRDISMLVVSAPLFWIHWRILYRDWMEERGKKKDEDNA
ncbi:MAG: hypothetical protein UY77_C0012G0007 [Candidatus Uhrbacteria bacterium GW2011_GWA2_53_10]|uniref:DUF5671 domain-containing protein n=1 Tax=Candidatus Uhrbacteria bacterium GW2011_GWA2_53_10 TaxID=1618980 RepID=A0A0G1XPN7_9BACT|nr:MAG: hypothetical protein UY77_C0012G0007 [Candidatus Uhrbacteria bacterium GW2011_GWA2_53_10]